MRAGLLRDTVEILRAETTVNAYGERAREWSVICTTRARVLHTGGRRTETDREVWNDASKTFEVRCYHDITTADRLRYAGKVYLIEDIDVDKYQRQSITIRATLYNE